MIGQKNLLNIRCFSYCKKTCHKWQIKGEPSSYTPLTEDNHFRVSGNWPAQPITNIFFSAYFDCNLDLTEHSSVKVVSELQMTNLLGTYFVYMYLYIYLTYQQLNLIYYVIHIVMCSFNHILKAQCIYVHIISKTFSMESKSSNVWNSNFFLMFSGLISLKDAHIRLCKTWLHFYVKRYIHGK